MLKINSYLVFVKRVSSVSRHALHMPEINISGRVSLQLRARKVACALLGLFKWLQKRVAVVNGTPDTGAVRARSTTRVDACEEMRTGLQVKRVHNIIHVGETRFLLPRACFFKTFKKMCAPCHAKGNQPTRGTDGASVIGHSIL